MIIERVKTWLLGAGAGLALIAAAFAAGRRGGAQQATQEAEHKAAAKDGEQAKAAATAVVTAVQDRAEVERHYAQESDDAITKNLEDRWTR